VPASASATGSGGRLAGDSHSGDSCSNQRNRKERLIALGHRISPCVFRRSGHRFVVSGNLNFAAPGRCDGHHNFADSSGWRLLYEFALTKSGTFVYHPHSDEMVQMAMGMMRMFVMHPRDPAPHRVDRDFAFIMSAYRIERQTIPTLMFP
jgi:hypothetical protein